MVADHDGALQYRSVSHLVSSVSAGSYLSYSVVVVVNQ